MKVSWNPSDSVATWAQIPQNSATAKCEADFKGYSDATTGISAVAGAPPLGLCESLFFLQAAFAQIKQVSPAGLLTAVQDLGTSFVSPNTIGSTSFGPGRYDGASEAQVMVFDPAVEGFKYIGTPIPVPPAS
jgi:hypothetical protein